ncbi:MAG: hypothetical protein OIF32_00655, partial [Campylobacterales bacterium]|nr:hypothetical protein [Campylobacterales bacterium]
AKSKGEKFESERLTRAKADKTELEVLIKSGQYLYIEDVKEVFNSIFAYLKKHHELMANSICGPVTLEKDVIKNKEIIKEYNRKFLENLSRTTFESLNVDLPSREFEESRKRVEEERKALLQKEEEEKKAKREKKKLSKKKVSKKVAKSKKGDA